MVSRRVKREGLVFLQTRRAAVLAELQQFRDVPDDSQDGADREMALFREMARIAREMRAFVTRD